MQTNHLGETFNTDEQLCDCGHPLSWHTPVDGLRSSPCTSIPSGKTHVKCHCPHPTTTGVPRNDRSRCKPDVPCRHNTVPR